MKDCGLVGDKDEDKAGCMLTSKVQLSGSELEMTAPDTACITAVLFLAAVTIQPKMAQISLVHTCSSSKSYSVM